MAAIPVTLGSASVLSLPLRHSQPICPNWWYHQAVITCSNAQQTHPPPFFPSCPPTLASPSTLRQSLLSPHRPLLYPPIYHPPTPTLTKATPPPVPPLRPRLRLRLRPHPHPRRRNAFAMFLLLRRLRSRANQAWLATSGGTPCVSTLMAGTGASLSSQPAERPRTIRERASAHLRLVSPVVRRLGGTTKSFGTSRLLNGTEKPVRSLGSSHAIFAMSDSRGGTLLPDIYRQSTQVRFLPSID